MMSRGLCRFGKYYHLYMMDNYCKSTHLADELTFHGSMNIGTVEQKTSFLKNWSQPLLPVSDTPSVIKLIWWHKCGKTSGFLLADQDISA